MATETIRERSGELIANGQDTYVAFRQTQAQQAQEAVVGTIRLLHELTAELREMVFHYQSDIRSSADVKLAFREDVRRKAVLVQRVTRSLSQMNDHYDLEPHIKLEAEVRLSDAESVYQLFADLRMAPPA